MSLATIAPLRFAAILRLCFRSRGVAIAVLVGVMVLGGTRAVKAESTGCAAIGSSYGLVNVTYSSFTFAAGDTITYLSTNFQYSVVFIGQNGGEFASINRPGQTYTFTIAGTYDLRGTSDPSVDYISCVPQTTFTVTTTSDLSTGVAENCLPGAGSATCSLRDALAAAAAASPATGISVNFSPTVFLATNTAAQNTITLGSGGTLNVPNNTTIQGLTTGSGATLTNLVTVDGNQANSVFTQAASTTGTIKNLIIQNGNGGNAGGGGILANGTLSVYESTIKNNTATQVGGGIAANYGSSVTVTACTINGNSASAGGGLVSFGTLVLSESTVTGNQSTGNGFAGVEVNNGTTTITDSTITGNGSPTTSIAGGVGNLNGTLTISDSIVAGNLAINSPDIAGVYTGHFGILPATTQVAAATPALAPLGYYGGPTQTMPALPGGNAFCNSSLGFQDSSTTDQRGFPRTHVYGLIGTTCLDSGATESTYTMVVTTQPAASYTTGVNFSPAPVVTWEDHGYAIPATVPVVFSDADGAIAGTRTVTMSGGTASPTAANISTAEPSDTLTATYTSPNFISGDHYVLTATTNSFAVNPAITGFSITGLGATDVAGTPQNVTIMVLNGNSTATAFTGTVTFTSTDSSALLPGTSASYTFVAGDNGLHTFTGGLTFETAGVQTLTVTSGSITTTSANVTVTAGAASTIVAASGKTQSALIGAAFAQPLLVQVQDAYANPVGGVTVAFAAPATTGPSATLSANTCVTATTSSTNAPLGTCSVTATANGTASTIAYSVTATATGVTNGTSFTLTNKAVTPTLTVTASPATLVYGQPVTITATSVPASAGGSSPTSAVTFYDNTTTLTPTSTPSFGVATYATTAVVGSQAYGASTAGDTNFAGVTKTTASSITVGKAMSSLSGPMTQPVFVVYNQTGAVPVTVAGQYSGTGISTPGGSVSYTIGAPCSGAACTGTSLIASGAANVPVASTLAPGFYTVTINYAGDTNYSAATAITVQLQVGQIQPTITWAQPAAITYGITLATVLNAQAFNGASVVAGTYAYTVNGSAVTAATVLPANSYTISVLFTPTDTTTYKTATSSVSLTVNKATPTFVLTTSATPVLQGTGITFTATLPVTATGTVTFLDGTTVIGAGTVSSGVASLTVANLLVGSHSIVATYPGDTNYFAATSNTLTQSVLGFDLQITTGVSAEQTVGRGGTAKFSFTVAPSGTTTFLQPVTFTLSGLPAGVTATITPSTAPAGAGPVLVGIAVHVPGNLAMLERRSVAPIALALLLMPFALRRRKTASKLMRASVMALLLLCGVSALSGCGSTPPETYELTLTGTSGTLVHTQTLTLIVK